MGQTTVIARADMVELPAGVTSMDEWGRNILTWGKFKKHGWTYSELCSDPSSEVCDYRDWICSHRHTGSSHLQDLAKYILARRELGTLAASTGTVVTAGGLVRHVKPPGH